MVLYQQPCLLVNWNPQGTYDLDRETGGKLHKLNGTHEISGYSVIMQLFRLKELAAY